MVKDEMPVVKLDSVRVAFDDERVVANAGLMLVGCANAIGRYWPEDFRSRTPARSG